MSRFARSWVAGVFAIAACGCVVSAAPVDGYVVYESPPPPRTRVSMVAPFGGAVWIGGYWTWTGTGWAWVEGRWVAARPGHVWIQPRWVRRGTGWVFVQGSWEPRYVHVQPPRGSVQVRPPRGTVEVRPPRGTVEVRPR